MDSIIPPYFETSNATQPFLRQAVRPDAWLMKARAIERWENEGGRIRWPAAPPSPARASAGEVREKAAALHGEWQGSTARPSARPRLLDPAFHD